MAVIEPEALDVGQEVAPISVGWYGPRHADSRVTRKPGRLVRWLLLGGFLVSWWITYHIEPVSRLALWSGWLCGLVGLLAWKRVRVFGPICFWDMVRTGRRGRYAWLRALYALVLLATLSWVYAGWFLSRGGSLASLFEGGSLDPYDLPLFGLYFFLSFFQVQTIAVLLLTPVYVASSLTEEKETRTLENLLATDLEDRELILGKLACRLGQLLLVLLAGLPIMAATQFLGGVEPGLIVAGFFATAVSMLSLASLSVLCSVHSPRISNAVLSTYFWVAVFLLASASLSVLGKIVNFILLMVISPFIVTVPSWLIFPDLNFGNPLLALVQVERALGNRDLLDALTEILIEYGLFQVLLAAYCCTRAVRKLREVALYPDQPKPLWRRSGVEFPPRLRRPKLANRSPLLWKEIHADAPVGTPRFSALLMYMQIILGWVVAALFVFLLPFGALDPYGDEPGISGELSNTLVRSLGTFLASVMLLAVAFYAAGTVSRERERKTLDGLLTLPVEVRDILFAKWLGAMLTVRPLWWCLAIIGGLGLVTGGLHPFAIPLVLLAWWIYAAFISNLGLFFSLRLGSTLRATLWTLGTVFFLVLAAALLTETAFWRWLPAPFDTEAARLVEQGLQPTVALAKLAFRYQEHSFGPNTSLTELRSVLAGLALCAAAAGVLWLLNLRCFRRTTRPEQQPVCRKRSLALGALSCTLAAKR